MKFNEPELECTFEIPEPLSYELILAYDSEVEFAFQDKDMYKRLWRGVQTIAVNWQCPHIKIDQNLSEASSEMGVRVIKWAGMMAFSYRQELKTLPLAGSGG